MGRKKLFSLIEIAVAMAVAAIGVAAIMALLPIAVKSTSDSVGDTLAADVANTVIAQLDRASWEHFEWFQNNWSTSKPTVLFDDTTLKKYAAMNLGENSYQIEPSTGLQNGHFVFLFGPPGKPADFAAEVVCWKDNNKQLKMTSMNTSMGTSTLPMDSIVHPETRKQSYVRVFIEITWPITKKYKNTTKNGSVVYPRQSRLFVREYMDPTYCKSVK